MSLTFSVQDTETSAAQAITLKNIGSGALTITNIASSGDFSQTNNCPNRLPSGKSCTINVTFAPTAAGTRNGNLTVTDNTLGVPGSKQTVPLSGAGQDFTMGPASESSSSQTVSPGQTSTYILNVSAQGGFSQSVNFSCSGAPSEVTCSVSPSSAMPGSNITVTVTTTAPDD